MTAPKGTGAKKPRTPPVGGSGVTPPFLEHWSDSLQECTRLTDCEHPDTWIDSEDTPECPWCVIDRVTHFAAFPPSPVGDEPEPGDAMLPDDIPPGPWITCCNMCTEALHPEHPRGVLCVLAAASKDFAANPAALGDAYRKATAALRAVLELHTKVPPSGRWKPFPTCRHDRNAWPCSTVKAITDALAGE